MWLLSFKPKNQYFDFWSRKYSLVLLIAACVAFACPRVCSRQYGLADKAPDSKSGNPGFKSRWVNRFENQVEKLGFLDLSENLENQNLSRARARATGKPRKPENLSKAMVFPTLGFLVFHRLGKTEPITVQSLGVCVVGV